MENKKNEKLSTFGKIARYIPVFIILLAITIMVGSTFAYFTDTEDEVGELNFSKVELSSETNVGINGVLRDVIPGTKLVDGEVAFSKAIDSEAIYVRAKISFSLPEQYKNDTGMQEFINAIRTATNFNLRSGEQHGAVWSAKKGNYFYLVESDNVNTLKRVDTIDRFVLSDEIIVPRDLEQLPNNAQYMKSINFHVAFEAIQADNVTNVLADAKELFDLTFPAIEDEVFVSSHTITYKDVDKVTDLEIVEINSEDLTTASTKTTWEDALHTTTHILDGWYTDADLTNKYEFGDVLTADITLYPKVYTVSSGLEFTAINNNTAYSVAKGTNTEANVVLPFKYRDKPVTEIKSMGFRNTATLESIYMPNITAIRSDGFSMCSNLDIDELPSGLTELDSYAFFRCSKLTISEIPSAITVLKDNIFYGCKLLELDGLSDDITEIQLQAFSGCTSLALTKLPDSLTTIGSYAFNDCENLAITSIPNGVTEIPDYAFSGCTNMPLESLPNNLEVMGESAMSWCNNLKFTTLPNSLHTLDINTFSTCRNLALTSLSNALSEIPERAFYDCDSLVLTSLPSGLINIGDYAFYRCYALELNVDAPSALYSVGRFAFASCTSLKLKSLPDNLTIISSNAFDNCPLLALTKLPANLTTLGSSAFSRCSALAITSVPAGITTLESSVFNSCTSITSLIFEGQVTTLNSLSIANCTALELVVLPASVNSISTSLFQGNTKLNYILCGSDEVSSYASGKGRANDYIYTLNSTGDAVIYTNTTIGALTIGTGSDASDYPWVRMGDATNGYTYYKCLVADISDVVDDPFDSDIVEI